MHSQKKYEWRGSAVMYRQHWTFSNRCAPSESDLEVGCVCLCVHMLTQIHFPRAKPLPVTERGMANRYQWSILQSNISFSSIHLSNRVHPRAVNSFPNSQSFFSTLTVLIHSKTQHSVIPQWQEQKEGSSACSDTLLCAPCSWHKSSTLPRPLLRSHHGGGEPACHLMQLDSVTTMGLKWIFLLKLTIFLHLLVKKHLNSLTCWC